MANTSETFSFNSIPTTLGELKMLPEAKLDSPYKAAALSLLALINYDKDKESTFEMLDFLKGPDSVSEFEKQFIRDRIAGKHYKVLSFFKGATVDNNYTPTTPYTITVSSNPYSFPEDNWATLYVKSAGADSERPIKLRKKPSTGEWFVNDIQCLADIRTPKSEDPWA